MDLQQAIQAFDDLHAGIDARAFNRDIGDAVDLNAGRDLDPQRGITGQRQETLGDGSQKGGMLRLQRIQKNV
jgi:hypothetical protein